MRCIRLSGLAFALAVGVAIQAAAAPPAKPRAEDYVDLSPAGVAIVSQGRVVNYVFVTLRLITRPGSDTVGLREKEPYFRDALVRLGDHAPLNAPGDLTHLDDKALKARMLAEASRIAGPGVVTSVQVLSETSQHPAGSLKP